MDTKLWFISLFVQAVQNIEEKIPIGLRYISLVVLLSCTLPLFLADLPSIESILVVFVILIIAGAVFRYKLIFYAMLFTACSMNFVWHVETMNQQKLPYESAKQSLHITAEVIDFVRHDEHKTSLMVRLVHNCDVSLCEHQSKHQSKHQSRHQNKRSYLSHVGSSKTALSRGSLVSLSCYRCKTAFSLGEVWTFSVKLKPPRGKASWRAFDYEKYAFATGISAVGYLDEKASSLLRKNDSFKNKFRLLIRQTIMRAFPNEKSEEAEHQKTKQEGQNENQQEDQFSSRAFLLALIVGDRSELDSTVWKQFSQTGVSHLMAISGLHISLMFLLVSVVIYKLMSILLKLTFLYQRRFSADALLQYCSLQTFSMFMGFSAALAYALAAGFSLPTQRALLMLLVMCIVKVTAWRISLFDALCCAVLCLLIVSPLSTLFIGFWLSVVAVAMIFLLTLSKESKLFMQVRLALAMTPFSLMLFGHFPWVSPLANLVLIPLVGFVILPSAFVLLMANIGLSSLGLFSREEMPIGFISEQLTALIMNGWLLLDKVLNAAWSFLIYWAKWQQAWSFSPFPASDIVKIIAISLCVLLLIFWRLAFARALLLIALLMLFTTDTNNHLKEGEFILTTLDVGQGLAIVIETQYDTILFDAGIGFPGNGKANEANSASQIIIPYLQANHSRPTSHIIISHGDNDHIGGFSSLVERFPMATLLSNDNVRSHSNFDVQACYDSVWYSYGVKFRVFSKFETATSRNNSSCVMQVSSRYGSVLLPADIERKVEHHLVSKYSTQLDSDVLIVGHHGSRTSSTPAFINQVKPAISIVSAAYFSAHGHPHSSVVKRLENQNSIVLSTAQSGSIQLQFLKSGLEQREYRAMHPRFWYSQSSLSDRP